MSDEKKRELSPEGEAMLELMREMVHPSLRQQAQLSQEEMEAIRYPPAEPFQIETKVACKHPNGYRFTALVAPSAKWANGRWVKIEDEQWPTDEELCETIEWWGKRNRWFDPMRPDLGYDDDTKRWLYENIRLPILRMVGAGPVPTDWLEGELDTAYLAKWHKELKAKAERHNLAERVAEPRNQAHPVAAK